MERLDILWNIFDAPETVVFDIRVTAQLLIQREV